ncbi:MAG TPA: VCBS repeat-containing protein [Planctomycetota bacterium]
MTLEANDRYGVVVDLDADGYMDAVSWWWANLSYASSVRLKGWRNDGTGKLVQAWTTTVEVSTDSPAANSSHLRLLPCELDGDGRTDFCLVFTSPANASVRALRSQGLVAPELVPEYSITWSGNHTIHAAVADFTGDGRGDLAYTLNGSLRLLEYVPGEPALVLRSQTSPFGSPSIDIEGLLSVDANGDATPDLLAWLGDTVKLIAVADCRPIATQTHSQGIGADHMVAAGDVDGDGDQDVVIWDMSRYVVARRTGSAAWTFEPPVTGGPAEFLVDVDADGDLDGVCCGGGDPSPTRNVVPSTFRVALNDGTGAFAPALETSWLGSDHLAGIADLDHDGDLDVVSGRCILYARGPLTEVLHPPLGAPKTERATADLDGDADPDFAVGLRTIERNLGAGLCAEYEPSFPPAPAGTVFVGPGWPGDFDGDGDLDLIVKHFAGSTLLAQRLLVNLGGGAFADAGDAGPSGVDFNPDVADADAPESSLAADADGDGDVDLIALGVSPGWSSRVWWNDGSGHFGAGPTFVGELVRAVADVTGDGVPDLVSLVFTPGWRAGLGGGTFGARVELPETVDAVESHVALADLDSDGDLDFAIPRHSANLQLYWNDGTGSFTNEVVSTVTITNAAVVPRVWSSDVDGDGRLDLLVAPEFRATNGLLVLRRLTDNSGWDAPVVQVVYEHDGNQGILLDVVLRDVDGDADVDLVTDRLVRNGKHSLPRGGRRQQAGAGTPGTGGLVPTLGADGPFRLGESAELRVRGAVGGASGLLTIFRVGDTPHARGRSGQGANAPEAIHQRIPFVLDGTPGSAGEGEWTLPYTVTFGFVGDTRRYVVEIYDPGAPGGVARTNELRLTYGY